MQFSFGAKHLPNANRTTSWLSRSFEKYTDVYQATTTVKCFIVQPIGYLPQRNLAKYVGPASEKTESIKRLFQKAKPIHRGYVNYTWWVGNILMDWLAAWNRYRNTEYERQIYFAINWRRPSLFEKRRRLYWPVPTCWTYVDIDTLTHIL